MTKAIFFDIDGTLISKKNPRITTKLKETLNALRNKGILLFIATGRHYQEIVDLKLNEDYQFDAYITLNGCYCYNDDEVIHKAAITNEDIKSIISMLDENDTACMFVEADKMYINKVNERVIEAQAAIHTPVPEIADISRALENDIFQIIPYITDEEAKPIIASTKGCKGTRWHPLAYDIIPNTGGKDEGIKKVLSYYNIDVKDTMAFGDGHNDIEMLQFVNIGVAMGNGEAITKESSD
ncbi:MAG: Cof-type HAD-IIB family hydrolase, partial [Coprobacillaceae bacterium]